MAFCLTFLKFASFFSKLKNPTESFKFAAMKSSSVEEYFRYSDNEVFQRMNTFMEKYNTDSNEIGTQKVVNR